MLELHRQRTMSDAQHRARSLKRTETAAMALAGNDADIGVLQDKITALRIDSEQQPATQKCQNKDDSS